MLMPLKPIAVRRSTPKRPHLESSRFRCGLTATAVPGRIRAAFCDVGRLRQREVVASTAVSDSERLSLRLGHAALPEGEGFVEVDLVRAVVERVLGGAHGPTRAAKEAREGDRAGARVGRGLAVAPLKRLRGAVVEVGW